MVAVIVTEGVSAEEFDRWVRERLAPYKAPRYYVFVDALPRSGSGKTLKRHLRDRIAAGDVQTEDLRPDRPAK